MQEAWLHFAVFTLIQCVFFLIHAVLEKKARRALSILMWGIPVGIVVGVLSDLLFGQLLGLWSYALGFGWFFLHLNTATTYGLFAAHTLLMQRKGLAHFCLWSAAVMVVYEISNHFFRVWTYAPAIESLLTPAGFYPLLWVGYFATAAAIAAILHSLGRHFSFVEKLRKGAGFKRAH